VFVYTYAGYPILVAVLARVAPWKAASGPDREETPTVTVLLPVYNGAEHLPAKLESLLGQNYPDGRLDILVYSDGSNDESEEIVQSFAEKSGRVRLISSSERSGKPTALNVMGTEAEGQFLVLTDVRQTVSDNAVRDLVARFADPAVGCVSGNLVLEGATGAGFYWRYEKWIRASEARFRSMVGVTGSLYAIRRSDFEQIPADTILDDMWIPLSIRLGGKRITLCQSAVVTDRAFDDGREWGRKTRTLAGNYQLFSRRPKLLAPFLNPSWFETISHKVLRLVSPWTLLVLFFASAWASVCPAGSTSPIGRWLCVALFAAQLVAYGAALLGPRGGRIPGVARTFVVLNAAAVNGLWRFLRGRQRITW